MEWSSAILPILKEGHELKLPLSGRSMHPLSGGRDEVVIKSIDNMKLKRGILSCIAATMVLCFAPYPSYKNYSYYMLGDAQTWIEGPIDGTQVLAVAVYIIRKVEQFHAKENIQADIRTMAYTSSCKAADIISCDTYMVFNKKAHSC